MSNYYDNAVHNNHSKHITINLSDDRAEAFLHDFLRDDDLPLWKNKEEKIKYLLDTQSAESGFSFLLDYHDDKHPYPVEERNRWIFGDFCAEVVFDFDEFNRMCYIMDYRECPEEMPKMITKWIRQFLRERPSFDYDTLKEDLYDQLEEMMFDFTDCYFDYVGKDRWGIYLDYDEDHLDCYWENINFDETFVRHFRLDIWKETIMNYGVKTTARSVETIDVHKTPLTWQQILTDYALLDDKCKEAYGSHNVRIAMYIKALEDVHLLNISERQSDKAPAFYQFLSNIFGYPIIQRSVEWQLNHFQENDKNKHTYEMDILPAIQSAIKAA